MLRSRETRGFEGVVRTAIASPIDVGERGRPILPPLDQQGQVVGRRSCVPRGKIDCQSRWGARTTGSDSGRICGGIQPVTDCRMTPPERAWSIGFQRHSRSGPIRSGGCALRSTASREGPCCMFTRTDGLYCIRVLSYTVHFRDRIPQSTFLSFRPDKDALEYALSMVQFLRPPDLHLVYTGKQ